MLNKCFCQVAFTGKPSEAGEMDLMEEDAEESRAEGESRVFDLFDDNMAEATDTNEAGELQNLTGILISIYKCMENGLEKVGWVGVFFPISGYHQSQ